MNLKRSVFWPCGTCRKNCISSCVSCDTCNSWYHSDCEKLEYDDFKTLSKSSLPYICLGCMKEDIGEIYSFEAALMRISEASRESLDYLRFVCKREVEHLPDMKTFVLMTEDELSSCEPDHVSDALHVMQYCGINNLGRPLKSLRDGNCLFSSVSLSLAGNNTLVTELRVRTCIEMVLNHEVYKSLPNSKELYDTSPPLDDSSLDCAKPQGFSSQWTIYALSHAIGVHINVVYPPVNGKEDRPYKTFNVTCTPRNEDVESQRNTCISVMWSNVSPNFTGIWTANHFVPLVRRNM